MSDFLDELVATAKAASTSNLPDGVVHAARRHLVDTAGAALSGMTEHSTRGLAEEMARGSSSPTSSILGTSLQADAMWAALANCASAAWHETDPRHPGAGGRPGSYAFSAALAIAEREGASGSRFLESYIGGYEIGARVGLGTTLQPGMDPDGSWPIVAGAAAAGLVLGYEENALRQAINLVTSFNLASSCRAAYEGATIRPIYAGYGAAMGVMAADSMRDGFTAERDGISTVFGGIAGVFFDIDKAMSGIGEKWLIEEGYHNPFSCSGPVHPSLKGLKDLVRDHGVAAEEVDRIEVRTYAGAAAMNLVTPAAGGAARLSIPYVLASYLVLRATGPEAFTPTATGDPRIVELSSRISVLEDTDLTMLTPGNRCAVVKLILKDGRCLEKRGDMHLIPSAEQAMTDEQISEKFLNLACPSIPPQIAHRLLQALWKIEAVADMRELSPLLMGRI